MNNSFTNSLKLDTKPIISNSNSLESLLKDLGIFPLPENVQAQLSYDNKYLELKLRDTVSKKNNKHILFQIPLEENDLSSLKNRSDYQELINRYFIYTNEYIDQIKEYAMQERSYLEKKFPGLVLNIKIRIKSFESYLNKLNKNILEGKSPYIDDIMAERIVITEYKNCKNEKILSNMCDEVAKALYDFRIDTNFRMKKNVTNNSAPTSKEYVTKDYIETPKENGYQSLHILMENKDNPDFNYETQIRTFEMEHLSKNCGEIAHNKYKPRILNDLSVTRVPLYSVITQFNDSLGSPIIIDTSFEQRFYHFFNTALNNPLDSKRSLPITYTNYKEELYGIEKSLGTTFKSIRRRLRNIDLSKYIKKDEERCK